MCVLHFCVLFLNSYDYVSLDLKPKTPRCLSNSEGFLIIVPAYSRIAVPIPTQRGLPPIISVAIIPPTKEHIR